MLPNVTNPKLHFVNCREFYGVVYCNLSYYICMISQ